MRNLDSSMATALSSGVITPAIMAQLTFRSGTYYVWTGYGPLVWNSFTFLGVGSLAGLAPVAEGTEVRADGTTVSLSGVDPTLYADTMTDVQVGAAANVWFGLLHQGTIIGNPYLLFSGQVDKPSVTTGVDNITVSLALENKLTNLQKPNARRYTLADQRRYYPDDIAFSWVEILNDIALRWGS